MACVGDRGEEEGLRGKRERGKVSWDDGRKDMMGKVKRCGGLNELCWVRDGGESEAARRYGRGNEAMRQSERGDEVRLREMVDEGRIRVGVLPGWMRFAG